MKIRKTFPNRVREIENLWIPLMDGTRLAARCWLPQDADSRPVPAIVEYIPYCKRDGTATRDEAMHPYFAGHGYAAIRVDVRGSGESEGLLHGEYLQQELDDAVEVIAWLAQQSWCCGRVGMMGKSWGGFNALQVAALQPPALACIITVCSTDDRYADDVHYMGGCLNVANPNWAHSMFQRNPRPPDPDIVGEQWRESWLQRIENNRPWIIDWLRHQRRDEFWQHGSVCEDFSAIRIPVYAIGGWSDSYSNAIPRLMQGLAVPRKALIGPWGHQYPHQGNPGPAVGFLQDALRWWDHWLKDIDTGMLEEPGVRVWMQEFTMPRAIVEQRPGSWIGEQGWPRDAEVTTMWLNGERLVATQAQAADRVLRSPQSTGYCCSNWINSGTPNSIDEPVDQREDDARSLVYDSLPLAQPLEILGSPRVSVELDCDQPRALICARLCEVLPDGTSSRVTYGVLNLTHREGHEHPSPLEPGKRYRVVLQLNDIAYRFGAGNRIRLALSNAYWPIVWPSPVATTLTIGAGDLQLPVREAGKSDFHVPAFEPPERAALDLRTQLRDAHPPSVEITRDYATGTVQIVRKMPGGRVRNDKTGWEHGASARRELFINDYDPLSARVVNSTTVEFGRAGDLQVEIDVVSTLTCDREYFYIEASMDVRENNETVHARTWSEKIERDHA